jgi:hypothetical protein
MARLRARIEGGRTNVTMSGHLTSRDLGRLERLCAPALEHEHVPLTLHMRPRTTVDPASRAYLARLVDRGAVLLFD